MMPIRLRLHAADDREHRRRRVRIRQRVPVVELRGDRVGHGATVWAGADMLARGVPDIGVGTVQRVIDELRQHVVGEADDVAE